jgi:nucleoside-diphosphate-sugar epimerase
MNEIMITGSTGVIGRRAVREVLAAGHRVTGVTRSAGGRERLESLGARAVEADVFDARSQRVSSRRLREASGWAPRLRAGTDAWRLIAA